jgi:hypothetical protein
MQQGEQILQICPDRRAEGAVEETGRKKRGYGMCSSLRVPSAQSSLIWRGSLKALSPVRLSPPS